MHPDLERLIQLQQLETVLETARRTLADKPARLQAFDARLATSQQILDAARARLAESQLERRTLEKDAATQQARLGKFKDQSSSVKTNKEYTALLHEIEVAKQELDAIEERILRNMDAADPLAAAVKEAEAALAAAKKQIDADRQAMAAEYLDVDRQLAESAEARQTLVAQMNARLVAQFEQLVKGRKGIAVAHVTREGLCSACYVRLRPHLFAEIRRNDGIVPCENCQRILYWTPPPPAEAASAES